MRACLAVAFLLAIPCTVHAQLVRGRIVEAETERPIALAAVALLDDRDRVIVEGAADSTGAFRIRGWEAGKYRLRVGALGYETIVSHLLEVGTGEEFVLIVQLAADAIPLDPITVVSRARSSLSEIALRGYYDRRDTGRRIGLGRFLDRGDIERKGATRLTDALRGVAGLRVIDSGSDSRVVLSGNSGSSFRGGSGCAVRFYLDGLALQAGGDINRIVPLEWIESIEVYRRASEMPAEFLNSGACGVVAIWTRRG